MSGAFNLHRKPDENEKQYIWRLCTAKDNGIIDYKWPTLAEIINSELYSDPDDWLNHCVYRKEYRAAKEFYDAVFLPAIHSGKEDDTIQKIQKERKELEKVKIQLADQRRELRKHTRLEARAEHLHEIIKEAASRLPAYTDAMERRRQQLPQAGNAEMPPTEQHGRETEAVLFLNDWHYGMTTQNVWNVYDTNVCCERVEELLGKVCVYLARHEVNTIHIVLLGDMCAGAIHTGTRVEAEEVVCEQLMSVSEVLAWFIANIAQNVPSVKIYSTYGNHMRTMQNKHDSIHRDNMERIIPWWLMERFAAFPHVQIIEQEQYAELIHVNACGYDIVATHGDLEILRKAGPTLHTLFSKTMGIDVDYIVVGDKHHAENIESLGVDCTIVPALCGTDEYAHTKRLYSSPAQTLMMFTPSEGQECVYRIEFSH